MQSTAERPFRPHEQDWVPRPTLSGHDYVSDEVYEQECERIWWGDWVCLGRTEEIPHPGDYLVRTLGSESLLITRSADGRLRGFFNVCTHRGTKLLDEGTGSVRKAFRCPYHAWTFDLNGVLLGTPNVPETEHFDRSSRPLWPVAVGEYAGFLWVNLAEHPRPLMEALTDGAETITIFERYRLDELRVGVRIVYEVAANWKIIVENYNECLHCPTIHPELTKVIPLYRFGEIWDERTPQGGNWMVDGASGFSLTGRTGLPPFPGLRPDDYLMYYGTYEFPNLMINFHPDCVMAYTAYPAGPGHTTVVSEYLFRPETIDDQSFDPQPVVDLWDLVSKQDWGVVARVQTGIGSRAYAHGIYPRQDRYLHDFNDEWRAAMGRALIG